MKHLTCDDKPCMSFASFFRILLSLLIASMLVVYTFAQSTTRFAGDNQRQTLRVRQPLRVQNAQNYRTRVQTPTQTPRISTPEVAPAPQRQSPVQIQQPIQVAAPPQVSRIRTPNPSITPNPTKPQPQPPIAPVRQEKIPEVSPSPIQNLKVQAPPPPPPPPQPRPRRVAYREVAPDSTEVRSRSNYEADVPPVESLPSAIPIPKEAYARRELVRPEYRVEQKPEEGIPPQQTPPKLVYEEAQPEEGIPPQRTPPKAVYEEQSPEDAPFTDPTFLTRSEESEPEVLPTEEVPKEEKPSVEETEVRTEWSIAAVEDKHPPKEEREEPVLEEPISVEPETVAAEVPQQEVNVKNTLARGAFIQLASYKKQDDATNAASSSKRTTALDNLFVYKIPASQYYKLVAGPFKKDDIGVQLLSLNRKGFSDAFVLKKH